MADDFSRVWVDDLDDLDAEQLNDMEARMEARVGGAGSGIELGYQTNGTTFTTSSTTANGIDVTSMSISVAVGARPIVVKVRADGWSATGIGALLLNQDGTNIGLIAAITGGDTVPLNEERRLQPSAGPHTYSLRAKNVGAGTVTITADAGTANLNSPMAIQVVEV